MREGCLDGQPSLFFVGSTGDEFQTYLGPADKQ